MKRFVLIAGIILLTSAVLLAETKIRVMEKDQWMGVFPQNHIAFVIRITDDIPPKFLLSDLDLGKMIGGEWFTQLPKDREIILMMEEYQAGEISFTKYSEKMRFFFGHVIIESDEGGDVIISKGGNIQGSTYLKEQKCYMRLKLDQGFIIYLRLLPPKEGEYYNILHFSKDQELVFMERFMKKQ